MKVGIDIEKLERLTLALVKRIATKGELDWLKKHSAAQHLGSIWTAKEAAIKALGGGDMRDVELLHEENGRPKICLHGGAEEAFKKQNLSEIEVSISHTKTDAISIVIMK